MFKGTIRFLEESDRDAAEKIFDQYWQDDFRGNLSEKIRNYLQNDFSLQKQNFKFLIAEEEGVVVGVAGLRKAPEHMLPYATTLNSGELYVVAVKNRWKGIGTALVKKCIEIMSNDNYKEVLLFSGESHTDAWKFHDTHFERVGPMVAPNGEHGFVWRKNI